MTSPDLRYCTTKACSAAKVGICYGVGGGVVLPRRVQGWKALPFSHPFRTDAWCRCLSVWSCSGWASFSACVLSPRCPCLRRVLLRQRTGMTASSLPFLLYETLEVGMRVMRVPDLLPMVPIRWLGIACLHDLSFTTMSTRFVK
jgi:hypothetical protein